MTRSSTNIIRSLLLTAAILLLPLFGNLYIEGWNWSWTAFVFFGLVLFVAFLAYEIAGKHAKSGVLGGFFVGQIVALCVITILRLSNPNEDVAGIVIITFLICGLLFAFVGYHLQNYIKRKS